MNQQRLFVFISLAISSVLGTFDNIGFVRDIGSNICRYTDFCYTSHKHTLTDDDLMPCCLPCDCSDDCWTAGNCCPDKVIKDVQTQKLNCKQALVKPDKMYADFMFDGFSLGIPRYRIVDSCPSDETNTSLIDGCQMIKKSVAEYTWVSDESGKIFQNRLCAYCNKALHFTEWSIRTRYPVVLLSNFSTLQQNIQSDDCDLLVEVPESERQVTDQYRCIIPKITTCNTTGLLLNRDNDIEHACSKYDSPVIVQHSVQYTIYKSIYCLVCNGFDETLETELCRSLKDVYKGPIHGIQFSALVDFERREENENRAAESECKIDEVYDTEKIQCYKLLCQFGSAPVNGVCTSIALKTYGLAVQIDYKLTIPHNQSCLEATAFVQANQESFGQAVFDSFTKVLSPHTGKCLGCDPWSVRADIGSDIQDPVDVIISSILYTNEQCQLNDIYAKAIDVFSTEIAVELDDMLSINMTIHLDDRTYRDTKKLPIIYREIFESCSPMIRLNDERLCPEIQLKSLDLPPSVAGTVTVNTETPVEGTNSTLVTVCWEDYISAITSTRSVSSDSASKPQFNTSTYITSTLSATLALNILLHQ